MPEAQSKAEGTHQKEEQEGIGDEVAHRRVSHHSAVCILAYLYKEMCSKSSDCMHSMTGPTLTSAYYYNECSAEEMQEGHLWLSPRRVIFAVDYMARMS